MPSHLICFLQRCKISTIYIIGEHHGNWRQSTNLSIRFFLLTRSFSSASMVSKLWRLNILSKINLKWYLLQPTIIRRIQLSLFELNGMRKKRNPEKLTFSASLRKNLWLFHQRAAIYPIAESYILLCVYFVNWTAQNNHTTINEHKHQQQSSSSLATTWNVNEKLLWCKLINFSQQRNDFPLNCYFFPFSFLCIVDMVIWKRIANCIHYTARQEHATELVEVMSCCKFSRS